MNCPYRGKNPSRWQPGSVEITFRLDVDVHNRVGPAFVDVAENLSERCQKKRVTKRNADRGRYGKSIRTQNP